MKTTSRKSIYWIVGLVGAAALVGTGATLASGIVEQDSAEPTQPVQIDDGAEFLGQASISLEEAIAAAQEVASGKLGDVDLEMYEGRLVFNVEIEHNDVKVDAADGRVLGMVTEEEELLGRDD
jgi:uncharacterized membrane protein YkoI